MKTLSLFFTLILVLLAQSCMKATQDPSLTIDGNKIGFGNNNFGNNGSSQQGPLGLYFEEGSNIYLQQAYPEDYSIKIRATRGVAPFTCELEYESTATSSHTPNPINNVSLTFPYGSTFEYCELMIHYPGTQADFMQIIRLTDSQGKSESIEIFFPYYEEPKVAMTNNFWCDFKVNDNGSLDYKCEGLGPLYSYGGVFMYTDFGNNAGSPYTVEHVLSGANHACVALSNGKVDCFGNNNYGQLGLNPFSSSVNGVQNFGVLSSFSSVYDGTQGMPSNGASGTNHTCLEINGNVKCWGNNNKGQLGVNPFDGGGLCEGSLAFTTEATCIGNGTWRTYTHEPKILSGTSVDNIVAGNEHTCYAVADEVSCTGDNSYGQLGLRDDDANSVTSIFSEALSFTTPNSEDIDEIAAGFNHNCVLYSEITPSVKNIVKCWGSNSHGQLGHDSKLLDINNGDNITGNFFDDVTTGMGEMDYIPALDLGSVSHSVWVENGQMDPCNGWSMNMSAAYQCDYSEDRQPYNLFVSGNKTCVIDQVDTLHCFGDYDVQEAFDVIDILINPNSTCAIFKNGTYSCFGN